MHTPAHSFSLLALLLTCASFMACTPPQEKAARAINAAIEECKKSKGDFATIEFLTDSKERVLRSACDLPLSKITIRDTLYATATQGPYTWRSGQSEESGIWVLSGVDWPLIAQARRIVEEKEPTPDSLVLVEKILGEAQTLLPKDPWIRQSRMENHLRRLEVKRRKDRNASAVLSPEVVAYLNDMQKWAVEQKRPDMAAKARLGVLAYYAKYKNITDSGLESSGSQDGHLQRLIDEAIKTKDKASKERYQKELDERIAKRPAQRKALEDRLVVIKAETCKQISAMSTTGIDDAKLQARITSVKSNSGCTN